MAADRFERINSRWTTSYAMIENSEENEAGVEVAINLGG